MYVHALTVRMKEIGVRGPLVARQNSSEYLGGQASLAPMDLSAKMTVSLSHSKRHPDVQYVVEPFFFVLGVFLGGYFL
jgi:hypothetical protein